MEQDRRGLLLTILLVALVGVLGFLARSKSYLANVSNHPVVMEAGLAEVITELNLKEFDPNEVDYLTLTRMGVDRNVVANLIRWRCVGKVYRIKEDVALCHGMTDSLYELIEPYIIIGEQYRYKTFEKPAYDDTGDNSHSPKVEYQEFRLDTVTVEYLRLLGFSSRQASLIVNYRDMIGGYRNIAEFEECYAVDSTMAARLKPYIIFDNTEEPLIAEEQPTLVNINSADSTALVQLRGIGPKSAKAIIEYRQLLGGYYDILQLRELNIITEDNFCKFSSQIYCESGEIEKIYINFARSQEIAIHPYISNRSLKRIINHRELKGGWSTIEEMIDSKIFNKEEAARIAPYLDFGTPNTEE